MISHIGVGIDIEEIARFEKLDHRKHHRFLERIFSQDELTYCFSKKNPAPHLTARFCAKEAIMKALGSMGERSVFYSGIVIKNDTTGAPMAFVKGGKNFTIQISMAHTATTAIALAFVANLFSN